MTQATITDDIALRIALAARALPDVSVARLLKVLEDAIGLPPTSEKLQALKVKDLRSALEGELADMDAGALAEAVGILKGDADADALPPPPVDPYRPGDMPDSIRVACASDGGERLDGHFGSARRFLIYQVSTLEVRLIEVRVPDDQTEGGDKSESRARLIADCQVLYTASIGGPAAAKVVKAGVHPIKYAEGGSARDRILALQRVLAETPPPWLAKVMGRSAEARVRFAREESGA